MKVHITIEGGQGEGKTNTAAFIANALSKNGVDVTVTDEGIKDLYCACNVSRPGLPDSVTITTRLT